MQHLLETFSDLKSKHQTLLKTKNLYDGVNRYLIFIKKKVEILKKYNMWTLWDFYKEI